MKLDQEAKLPPCHHWVYPSGKMTDDPERKGNSRPPARQRRAGGGGGFGGIIWIINHGSTGAAESYCSVG